MSFLKGIRQVIIWGYPKDTNTFSYIHEAFYRAFKYMGYETYWFHNGSDVQNFDFSNTLFLTSGDIECKGVPIRKDGLYILHNCPGDLFNGVKDRIVNQQVLVTRVPTVKNIVKVNEYTFIEGTLIYQPWATDLLPEEINVDNPIINDSKVVNYVGTVCDTGYSNAAKDLDGFARGCAEDGIRVHAYGGYTPGRVMGQFKTHPNFVTNDQHVSLIKESKYAPQFCGDFQLDNGYIPCRIFKNISYGHHGLTNSRYVNDIFDGELIFDPDGYSLYKKAKGGISSEKTKRLMRIVKEKHTYINRIKEILNIFE